MNWTKNLFRFYINSSLHVTLAICALAGITFLTIHADWDFWFFSFIFSASITGYNFVKYAGYAKFHHRSLTNQLKSIQIFSLFCFILLIVSTLKQSLTFILYAGGLGLFTLLYAVPFLPHHKNLRRIKLLKIIIIGFVWAIATAGLPLIGRKDLDWPLLLRITNYFFLVLTLIMPFEIRDLKYDDPKLGTLPQLIGIRKTKITGYILLSIFILTSFFLNLSLYALSTNLIITIITGIAIKRVSTHQRKYYASFWVESIPILWFILRLIGNTII